MKTIKELETTIEDKLTALEIELYEVKIEVPSTCPSIFNRRLSFVLRDRVRVAALMRQIADAITLVEESNPEFFDFGNKFMDCDEIKIAILYNYDPECGIVDPFLNLTRRVDSCEFKFGGLTIIGFWELIDFVFHDEVYFNFETFNLNLSALFKVGFNQAILSKVEVFDPA